MALRRSGLAAAAAVLLLGAGCGSSPPRLVDLDREGDGTLRVVVAPMNLPIRLAPDLEDAVEPVTQELIGYLQARGARVSVVFEPDAWSLWRDSTDALQKGREEIPDLAAVASLFARALGRESQFDVLVFPSLVFRDAQLAGRYAQWDGVRRRVRFRIRSGVPLPRVPAISDPVASSDGSGATALPPEYRGQITGLSLHALGFTPDGRGVFQGFGGLDLVHDTVQKREGRVDGSFLRLHAKLLENPEHVREGIALALDPYLVESRSR
jgi:hypothetical protein